ncbi:cadherin repeat domain-containing protein [Paenibacillus kobensis]|uniref:cadherin repeat domain-containing protein n=1 Tax=Paenibacillus kobensis TaxID=59841 RepID=UPI0013E28829|nr:cadherin repeat domain-containing protein [Paenibacillus kobensis]
MKLHHLAKLLLAVMVAAVLQPLLVVPKTQAAGAVQTKTIDLLVDKSVDAVDPWPGGVEDSGRHIVGYQWYGGVKYGDSRMYMKFPVDAAQIPAGAVIQKAELVLNVHSVSRTGGLPAMAFRVYSSNETSWAPADRSVPAPGSYSLMGSFVGRNAAGVDQDVKAGVIRLPVTNGVKDYLSNNPSASLMTVIFEGPTEQELKNAGINTDREIDDLAYVYAEEHGASFAADLYVEYTLNTAPTSLTLSNASVPENSPAGTAVGTLNGTDAEGGTLTYSLAAGGTDNALFQVSGNQLKTNAVFDYEAKNSYAIKAQVADSAGLTRTQDFTISVTNVNEAPTGSIVINGGSLYTNNSSAALTLTGSDPDGNPLTMSFSNDNSVWSAPEPFATSKSHTLSAGDGLKTVYYRLTDGALTFTGSSTITLDTAAPAGTLKINNGDAVALSSDVTLNLTASDLTAVQMRISNDATAWSAWEAFASVKPWTLSAGGGVKTVYVQLRDVAGNVSAISDTIDVDTTPPDGSLTIEGGKAAVNHAAVQLQLANPDSSAVSMQFQNESGAWSGWEPYAAVKSWTLSSGDGPKTVNAQLKDAAGNTASFSDGIVLDTEPPAVTGVVNGERTNRDVTVTFDGEGVLDGSSIDSGDVITAEGAHTLTVTDEAGNVTTVTFTIDKTAPDGSLAINGGAGAANSTSVNLTVSNPDGSAVQMRFSNDGTTWSEWETYAAAKTGWTVSGGDGTKTVYVELKDATGNVSQASDSIELDTAAPGGAVTIAGGADYTNQSAAQLQIANPDGSAVQMRFSNDGAAWSEWEAFATAKSGWALTSGDGLKTVYVELKDALGNSAQFSDTITLDTAAPVVDGVTNGGLYNTDQTITFLEGQGILDSASFTSGSTVTAEGVHTLTVTDLAGNQTTVTFEIDRTAPAVTVVINGGATYANALSAALAITSDGTASLVRFSNDGTTWSGWLNFSPSTVWTLAAGDGLKTVYVQIKDAAGNTGEGSASIRLDTTAPTGSAVINAGAPYTTGADVVVVVTASDAGSSASGISQISYSIDNGVTWSAWTRFIPTLSVKLPSGKGAKTVLVKVKDAAGNESAPFSDSITLR